MILPDLREINGLIARERRLTALLAGTIPRGTNCDLNLVQTEVWYVRKRLEEVNVIQHE